MLEIVIKFLQFNGHLKNYLPPTVPPAPPSIQDECQCAYPGRSPINLVLMIIVSISECLQFPSASPNAVLYDLGEKAPLCQHRGICEHFFAYLS